jgi:hypothetical protein
MKVTFESSDPMEIKRLAKADDMAIFIWELVNNRIRNLSRSGVDCDPFVVLVNELLEEFWIDIDELTN